MKIGILEIMPIGHYTLVDSVARIFSSDNNNTTYILTHKQGAEVLAPLLTEMINLSILTLEQNQSLKAFFEKAKALKLDRLYIITLEKYFPEIYSYNFDCPIYLFIHNIESWFQVNLNYRLYNFLKNFSFTPKVFYYLKSSFIYPSQRQKIISKVYKSAGKFVVLNKIIKKELSKFVKDDLIDVIPFSVYNKNLKDTSSNNSSLRICIPGMVSITRRDYISLFKIIESDIEFFRDKVQIDLLGGISSAEQGEKIIEYAKKLISNGIKIIYYKKQLVPLSEFDQQLTKADIILGNMHVVQNKFSKYGKTKESGIIFTMIRCGKPGLLPIEYSLIDELESSTIIFKDYEDLSKIIRDLIHEPEKINQLKEEALKNSHKFEPGLILNEIIK